MGVEGEVETEGPAEGKRVDRVRRGEHSDISHVGGGTKDDENATREAGARSVKKLGTGPNSART
jgi:hypothetical protein